MTGTGTGSEPETDTETAPERANPLEQLFSSRVAALLPDVVDGKTAAAVRQRLEGQGYARYALLDRGSYEVCALAATAEPQLMATLQAAAAQATGRALQLASALALRLGPGDYLLAHHDPHAPSDRDVDGLVELMIDLSPAEVAGADVVYRRAGRPFFQLPSQPGALSVVERAADVRCHHGYVSKRLAAAQVVRLVLQLRPA